jgi:hypothetical protein
MNPYQPGDNFSVLFPIESSGGLPVNFDLPPVITGYRNGVLDSGWTGFTLTYAQTGVGVLSGTIPIGYIDGVDEAQVLISGTVGGQSVVATVQFGKLAFRDPTYTVQSSPVPTAASFAGPSTLSNVNGFYATGFIYFRSGALKGTSAPVSGYVGAGNLFTFSPPFAQAPAPGDTFIPIGFQQQ